MIFHDFISQDKLGEAAANLIANQLSHKEAFTLCTATGSSPTLTYKFLAEKKNRFKHTKLTIVKLDEWGGIPSEHPASCEAYLQKHLIVPLGITDDCFCSFRSQTTNPEDECRRIQAELKNIGTIDICILGLGMNGHIAFNEPAEFLHPHCHVAKLSESSMKHPMALSMESPGGYGLSLGMTDILSSKTIIFIVSGENKKEIFREFMQGKITTYLPASFLWLHPQTYCFYTREVL